MPPQFWVTKYCRKVDYLNNQNTVLICNKKYMSIECKYPLVSHVSPYVEDGSPIQLHSLQAHMRDMHKSIKGLPVQPIAQVVFYCILFGDSSLTNSYTWWNECNFLPKLYKFRPIIVKGTLYIKLKLKVIFALCKFCLKSFQCQAKTPQY